MSDPKTCTMCGAYITSTEEIADLRARAEKLERVARAAREMFRKIDHEGYHVNAPCADLRDAVNALFPSSPERPGTDT